MGVPPRRTPPTPTPQQPTTATIQRNSRSSKLSDSTIEMVVVSVAVAAVVQVMVATITSHREGHIQKGPLVVVMRIVVAIVAQPLLAISITERTKPRDN